MYTYMLYVCIYIYLYIYIYIFPNPETPKLLKDTITHGGHPYNPKPRHAE